MLDPPAIETVGGTETAAELLLSSTFVALEAAADSDTEHVAVAPELRLLGVHVRPVTVSPDGADAVIAPPVAVTVLGSPAAVDPPALMTSIVAVPLKFEAVVKDATATGPFAITLAFSP